MTKTARSVVSGTSDNPLASRGTTPPQSEPPAPRPEVEAHASRPEVEARASRPEVEAHASRPEVEAHASRPEVEAHASRPEVEALVREHLPLVGHIVRQIAARYPRHVERDELWSAGALGLVDAACRFSPVSGTPFSRYAAIRIRGAIIDSNRDRDWAPRSLRRHGRRVQSAVERFEAAHGRAPSAAELATALETTEDDLLTHRADATRATVLHLDHPFDDGDDPTSLADTVREWDEDALPEESLERTELVGALREAIARLPEPQRTVVDRYYVRGHLLRDIAADRGVTEARISQICLEAVHALRAFLGMVFDDVPAVPRGAPGHRRRVAYLGEMAEASDWRSRMAAAGA